MCELGMHERARDEMKPIGWISAKHAEAKLSPHAIWLPSMLSSTALLDWELDQSCAANSKLLAIAMGISSTARLVHQTMKSVLVRSRQSVGDF
jgi:hypothetical protein